MKNIKRYLPIALIIILMIAAYFSGIWHSFYFATLKVYHHILKNYVEQHALLTPLMFMGVYILAVALSIPGAIFLTLLGGFLFSQPFSTIYVVVSASLGATVIFLAAKTAIGDFLFKKAGPFLKKMEKGFKENAVNYMLFLRFVPLFPFWLVNLAPAFFGIRLWTFIWTTFVGIIPGSFVFTQAGRGLSSIFETGGEFSLGAVFNLQVKIALVCLGVFSLLPIIIKKLKMKKKS